MYKFKNYDLEYERFGLLEVTRKINEDLELSDMGMYLIDKYVRELTQPYPPLTTRPTTSV